MSSPNDVVIVSACRTPVGSFLGALSSVPAKALGEVVLREALVRANVPASDVDEVIMGQVFTAGQGQNPIRQASMDAQIPKEIPAYGVNMLCGSGLKAVALGVQAIKAGDSNIVLAGGMESMSQSPHTIYMRTGSKMGNGSLVDTMMNDGLTDAFYNYHMGITAENVAEKYSITREQQDEFAVASQNKAEAAQAGGEFKEEIVSVTIKGRRGDVVVTDDEYIRKGSTLDAMNKLRPSFKKDGGSVTAGNASGLNDGAGCVMLMSQAEASSRGIAPLCRIVSQAQVGLDPSIMGCGPIFAVRKALEKAGWTIDDVDLFELNEAFAVQSLAVVKELGCDSSKVNVRGGAIAIGHPLGASGARVLTTLIYALKQQNKKKGVASLCIGGGMGIAMCIEL
eukprot:CFRG8195T1